VATDLAIGFAGADVYDVEPKQLPNLYHGMPVRVYGRYKHDGKADRDVTLTLSGTIAGHELKRSNTIKFPAQDDANPEIERMWAWHRVDRLLKQADANGTRTPVIDEIVRLGEGYSIVTEYTSFIVLENDGEYKRWKIDRKNALRIARDRGQQKAVASRLAKLREQATTEIGPVDPSAKLPELPGVASPNVQQASANPASAQPQRGGSAPAQRNGQGFDLTPGRGGGAIDPLTAAGMACLVVILWRVGRAKPRHRNA
jgi:Ca-activated chloride channel homolog